MTWTREAAAAYLAGMIDGEGSVTLAEVVIYNTEDDLIAACERCCQVLGIEYRLHRYERPTGKPIYYLRIRRLGSLRIVAAEVPIQSARKRWALTAAARIRTNVLVGY
jgi:hypothetical protein